MQMNAQEKMTVLKTNGDHLCLMGRDCFMKPFSYAEIGFDSEYACAMDLWMDSSDECVSYMAFGYGMSEDRTLG